MQSGLSLKRLLQCGWLLATITLARRIQRYIANERLPDRRSPFIDRMRPVESDRGGHGGLSSSLWLRLRWAIRRILAGFRLRAAPGEYGETE